MRLICECRESLKIASSRRGTVCKHLIRLPSVLTARVICHLQILSRCGWIIHTVVPSLLLAGYTDPHPPVMAIWDWTGTLCSWAEGAPDVAETSGRVIGGRGHKST